MTDLSLLQDFLAETSEHLEEMERNLLLLEDDSLNKELLDDIFRSIHTIKGSSDYLGMGRIAELSHRLENLLDLMRQDKRTADQDTVDLLIDGRDRIASLVADLEEAQAESTEIDDLLARLDAAASQETGNGSAHEPEPRDDPGSGAPAVSEDELAAKVELSAIENESDAELLAIFLDQFEAGVRGLREGLEAVDTLSTKQIDGTLHQLTSLQSSANYMGYLSLCRLYESWEKELDELRTSISQESSDTISVRAYWQNYLKPQLKTILDLIPAKARDLSQYLETPTFKTIAPDTATTDDMTTGGTDPDDAGGNDPDDAGGTGTDDAGGTGTDGAGGTGTDGAGGTGTDGADAQLFSDVCLDGLLDETGASGANPDCAKATEEHGEEPELSLDLDSELLVEDEEEVSFEVSDEVSGEVSNEVSSNEVSNNEVSNNEVPNIEVSNEAASDSENLDETLLADFFAETQEHLDEMEGCILALAQAENPADLLNDIFRCAHTIKGSADYIGLAGITELSHQLESYLDHLRQGYRPVGEAVGEVLMAAGDQLRDMITILATDGSFVEPSEDLLLRLAVDRDLVETGEHHLTTDESESPISETQGPSDPSAAPIHYIEENDQELLDIFLQQLQTGLEALLRIAGAAEHLTEPVLNQCREALAGLSSSANYMGYNALQQVYTDWEILLDDQLKAVKDGASLDSSVWLSENVLPFLKSVAGFFPQATELAKLWEAIPVPEEMAPGAPEVPPAADSDHLAQLGSAFDAMLLAQPPAGPHLPEGIEGELFSAVDAGTWAGERACGDLSADDGDTGTKAWRPEPKVEAIVPTETKLMEDKEIDPPDEVTADASRSEGPAVAKAEPATEERATASPALESPGPAAPEAEPNKPEAAPKRLLRQSIRVDSGKIDALMNQVGELVVNRAFFSQLCNEMRDLQHYLKQSKRLDKREFKQVSGLTFRISEATLALGRVANELQEGVMRVRMLPIAQLFNRYPRLVHDLARSSGKKVALQLQGEDTELDKMVIERIADPLVHIIRNAVDHGLETVEERLRKGKPEKGTLTLNAFHESNHVVIEIEDDGRGVDLERIRTKAIEKGLIGESAATQLSEREIINLILIPGFSTADTITHTSGRGVGMDVVKKNIEKLNGTLEVETTRGQSTRIRIKIPLTLAIIPALLVRVMDELFTIPLSVVDETLRVFKDEISVIEGVDVMYLRDETIPLIRLRDIFGMETRTEMAEKFFVVIVNTGQKRIGLIVDNMLGQEEVVIKPLEDYLQENSGFSGATILGDGQISLILDVYELIKLSTHKHARRQVRQTPI